MLGWKRIPCLTAWLFTETMFANGPFPLTQCLHETTIQSFLHVFCPICHNLPQSQKTVHVHRLYIDFLIHTTAVKWADSLKIPMQCGAAENSWTDSCKMPMQCGAAAIRQRSDCKKWIQIAVSWRHCASGKGPSLSLNVGFNHYVECIIRIVMHTRKVVWLLINHELASGLINKLTTFLSP